MPRSKPGKMIAADGGRTSFPVLVTSTALAHSVGTEKTTLCELLSESSPALIDFFFRQQPNFRRTQSTSGDFGQARYMPQKIANAAPLLAAAPATASTYSSDNTASSEARSRSVSGFLHTTKDDVPGWATLPTPRQRGSLLDHPQCTVDCCS